MGNELLTLQACWEIPLLSIFLFYYLFLLWTESPVSCENILLLPVLKRIGLLRNYNEEDRKILFQTIFPLLILTFFCPISFYLLNPLYGAIINEDNFYEVVGLVKSLPLVCLIYALIRLYPYSSLHSSNVQTNNA